MAGGGKRGGGDRVLESRHLVGLFLGVVLLCGVFFTLGYVMGRTQYGGSVHAETLSRRPAPVEQPKPANASAQSAPPGEWDFYTKKNEAQVDPAAPPKPVAVDEAPGVADADLSASPSAPEVPPAKPREVSPAVARVPKSGIVLQVAALRHQSDALAMAGLLQQKRFPSFVAAPVGGDDLYRVQVGPYTDEHAADAAKAALDRDGFKAIIKH
jgi:DedD protein